jgi:hypothetical protein
MKNMAVPNEVLAAPVRLLVGFVGGFSWEFVRFAVKMIPACPTPANRIVRTGTADLSLNMN